DSEKPSFENFLSKPSTLSDHLMWQLGSLHVNEDVYRAAELVIGNLNEEGYLTATDDELLGLAEEEAQELISPASSNGAAGVTEPIASSPSAEEMLSEEEHSTVAVAEQDAMPEEEAEVEVAEPQPPRPTLVPKRTTPARVPFSRDALREAID